MTSYSSTQALSLSQQADRLRWYAAVEPELHQLKNILCLNQAVAIPLLEETLGYWWQKPGKMVRAGFFFLLCQMFKTIDSIDIDFAEAIELLHAATLLHDDVVDYSELRRGQPAARVLYGNAASVLAGDYLYACSFKRLVQTKHLPALEIVSQITLTLAEGEAFQLAQRGQINPDLQHYYQIIDKKTASLFTACARLAVCRFDTPPIEVDVLVNLAEAIGFCFQMVDDALDYRTVDLAALGKNVGDDWRSGAMTLPILLAYQQFPDEVQQLIAQFHTEVGMDYWQRLQSLLQRCDAIDQTLVLAKAQAKRANDYLARCPDGIARQGIQDLIAFCLQRIF